MGYPFTRFHPRTGPPTPGGPGLFQVNVVDWELPRFAIATEGFVCRLSKDALAGSCSWPFVRCRLDQAFVCPQVAKGEGCMHRLAAQAQEYFETGLVLAARESMEKWLEWTRCTGTPAELCTALNGLGSVMLELNMLQEANACFDESVTLSADGSFEVAVRSLCNLSLCQYLRGMGPESVATAERAFARARDEGVVDSALLLHMHMILGLGHIACANWREAYETHERALALAEELSSSVTTANILNNLGLISVELGEFDAAEERLTHALRIMEELKQSQALAYTMTEFGRLHLRRGDVAQALHYGSLALRTLWENMSGLDKAEVARLCELFGSVAHATGDHQGAVGYLQRASTYYAQQDRWREWEGVSVTLNSVIRSPQTGGSVRVAIDWKDKQLLRYFTALLGLMDTMECLYPHLRGRSDLVAKYAKILGGVCGIDKDGLEGLSHAARLHDVGLTSMGEGSNIFSPAQGEGEGVGEHPLLGDRVLQMFDVPDDVRTAVRHHRERFDGSGGPDGLAGNEIPLYARIISVVEGYVDCALESADSKEAHTKGIEYIMGRAGTEYDPEVVDAFVNLHDISH